MGNLDKQLSIIRDYVRQVMDKTSTGLYLYGPPGTGKTHVVRSVLEGSGYQYHSGHLTPLGLYELLEAHADRVIVLDDVGQVLNSEIAVQLLLSALSPGAIRLVSYLRSGEERITPFRGGVILVSNKEPKGEKLAPFWSRVNTFKYSPTNEQLAAIMASIGPPEVVDFVTSELARTGKRFDLRHLTKARQHYQFCQQGGAENTWQELVRASLGEPVEEEVDTVQAFLSECKRSSGAATQRSTLYRAYRDWCLQNECTPLSQDGFGKALSESGVKATQRSVSGKRDWYYLGVST